MTVSVIIPCFNEENYVGKLLKDLSKQTSKPSAIYVVDCQSKDKTVAVAQSFVGKLPLSVLQSPYRSAAAARNAGAEAAKTDFLLFLDADMRLTPTFIERLLHTATAKKADFVSPRLHIEGRHPVDHAVMRGLNLWNHYYHMGIRRRAGGVGGAMLIRSKTHSAIGGYNPLLREFDDIDYMVKMWKHNVSFAYARGAVATTSNRRFTRQGRLVSLIQGLSEHHFLVRHVVRPVMKKVGIKPYWHDLD